MRAWFVSIGIISIIAVIAALRGSVPVTTTRSPPPAPAVSPSPAPLMRSVDITHNEKTYRVAWLTVSDVSRITLIPNFSQKRTARSLIDSKDCTEVINGGVYTKDNQPTGLFITQGKTIRGFILNILLNGYVVVDQDNNTMILSTPSEGSVRIALQTGPILIRDGNTVKLAIHDDEFARRVVAATTQKGEMVFLAIYDPDNLWSGPKLTDSPAIVSQIMRTLNITDAINLDGGSASVLIRGDLSLEELTAVGSFFCIK